MATDHSPSDLSLDIVTYNMQGFNQGILCLDSFCADNNYSVVFVQETWLNVKNMLSSLNHLSENYHLFCSSAMDEQLACGILRRRPFGGLCTLIHNSFYSRFREVECI